MKRRRTGDMLALVFLAAALYMVVRPQSKATQLVQVAGRAAVAVVRRATDIM